MNNKSHIIVWRIVWKLLDIYKKKLNTREYLDNSDNNFSLIIWVMTDCEKERQNIDYHNGYAKG